MLSIRGAVENVEIHGEKYSKLLASSVKPYQTTSINFHVYSTVHNHTQHSSRGPQEDDISRDGFRRLILNPAYVGAMGNTQS